MNNHIDGSSISSFIISMSVFKSFFKINSLVFIKSILQNSSTSINTGLASQYFITLILAINVMLGT